MPEEKHDGAVASSDGRLSELRSLARYHRDRHRLYQARLGGSRPVSLAKLAELKRSRDLAEESLRRAEEARRNTAAEA